MSFSHPPPTAGRKKTILLVEDEALIAINEASVLEKNGYQVITEYSAERAIKTAKEKTIDLILMDIDLGKNKMDGTEAAQIILQDRDLPIVILTSHTEKEMVDRVKGITRYGYVLKSSGEFVLTESISMAFELFKSYQTIKNKEEQLELAMDAEDHGYWDLNLDTNETYFSPRYYQMLGYEPGELPMNLSSWEKLLHPEDRETVGQEILKKVKSAEPFEAEFRLLTKEGQWKWVCGKGKSYYVDDKGIPHRAVGTHEDISEKKEAEETLSRVMEKVPVGLFYLDKDLTIMYENPKAREIIGVPEREKQSRAVKVSLCDFPSIRELGIDKKIEQLKRGQEIELDTPFTSIYGKKSFLHVQASPFFRNGDFTGAILMVQDITVYKETEERLQKSEEKASKIIENALAGIFVIIERRIVFINPSVTEITGYTSEEVKGNDFIDFVYEEDRSIVMRNYERRKKGEAFPAYDIRMIKKGGKLMWLRIDAAPVNWEGKEAILCFASNIDPFKHAELELRRSIKELDCLYGLSELVENENNSLKAVFSGLVRLVPSAMEYPERTVVKLTIQDLEFTADGYQEPPVCRNFGVVVRGREYGKLTVGYRDGTGKSFREDEVKLLSMVSGRVGRIIERAEAKEALNRSEKKFRTIVESSTDGIVMLDKGGNILDVNSAYCRMSGYTKEELLAMSNKDLEAHETEAEVEAHTKSIREKGMNRFESLHKRKDGSPYPVEVSASYIGAEEILLSFVRDISERKAEEEELKYMNALFTAQQEATIDGIAVVDGDDRIISYNTRFIDMWQIPKETAESGSGTAALESVLDLVEDPDSFAWEIRRLYGNRREKSQDEVKLKDGRTLFRYSAPLFGKDETYYGRLWLYRDITAQKQALEEKDFLMKELNHRVKNNLLMVTSLINLKDSSLGDTVDLSDIVHQVDTIRIVHEKLFKKEQITSVRLAGYIREIIQTIFSSFTAKQVTVNCSIPDISLPTRDAVSIGLIVNEIATNAVKHGFTDEQEPGFSVEMVEEAGRNRYVLKLANRGKPFPENVDLRKPKTLGLQLVSALVNQLQGTLELNRQPHPVFTIRFPKSANA